MPGSNSWTAVAADPGAERWWADSVYSVPTIVNTFKWEIERLLKRCQHVVSSGIQPVWLGETLRMVIVFKRDAPSGSSGIKFKSQVRVAISLGLGMGTVRVLETTQSEQESAVPHFGLPL